MDAQFIHHNNLPSRQTGRKDLLYVDLKGDSIGGSIQDHARCHPLPGQGRDQRHVFSTVSGNASIGPLSFGSTGIQRREGNIGPTFIHYNDLVGIELLDVLSIGCPWRFIAFGGPERLFFREGTLGDTAN
jgi:hypothetical protein